MLSTHGRYAEVGQQRSSTDHPQLRCDRSCTPYVAAPTLPRCDLHDYHHNHYDFLDGLFAGDDTDVISYVMWRLARGTLHPLGSYGGLGQEVHCCSRKTQHLSTKAGVDLHPGGAWCTAAGNRPGVGPGDLSGPVSGMSSGCNPGGVSGGLSGGATGGDCRWERRDGERPSDHRGSRKHAGHRQCAGAGRVPSRNPN